MSCASAQTILFVSLRDDSYDLDPAVKPRGDKIKTLGSRGDKLVYYLSFSRIKCKIKNLSTYHSRKSASVSLLCHPGARGPVFFLFIIPRRGTPVFCLLVIPGLDPGIQVF